ncbi:MAG: helix-turn-helix transcriptional regulator, partial [Firmicutes bacterium]|nr:helix-turn-helix transcriptional regulator [Bacillota bacterium]
SQRELADQVFVTRPTVVRWEKGSRQPAVSQGKGAKHD